MTSYIPFPLERSSSRKAMSNSKAELLKLHQASDTPGPIIQSSLFICDISFMYLFINISQSHGSGEQLKAKFSSHFSSMSREAHPVLLRMRVWGTNVLNALTSLRPLSLCVTEADVTYQKWPAMPLTWSLCALSE